MDDETPLRRDPGHQRHGAASQLASEGLDSYSQDELLDRIALLEAELVRVRAHKDKASAHRLAAEAFFRSSKQTTSGETSDS